MKNFTPVLVNTGKQKMSFKTFFLGSAAAKSYYYCGRHKTDDIYIMWIEASRFGTSYCYPCVLDEQGDPMVYMPGKGLSNKTKNAAMVQRWNLFVQPATFRQEFDVGELTPEEFHKEYAGYKNQMLEELLDEEAAEAEGTPAEALPAADEAAGPDATDVETADEAAEQ